MNRNIDLAAILLSCGIFVLLFVESVLGNFNQFLQPDLPDLSDLFRPSDATHKRKEVLKIILEVSTGALKIRNQEHKRVKEKTTNSRQSRFDRTSEDWSFSAAELSNTGR